MAQRQIGQERLALGVHRRALAQRWTKCRGCWVRQSRQLARRHLVIVRGRAGLAANGAVCSLAAGKVCDPSDVRLPESFDDRANSRRFCGFRAREATRERAAFIPGSDLVDFCDRYDILSPCVLESHPKDLRC